MTNADPLELEKFNQLAHRWWDASSEFKPLHDINPLRLEYINRIVPLSGKSVLDVGCGGGILSESMADMGAQVTGIDLGDKALQVAKLHLLERGHAQTTSSRQWIRLGKWELSLYQLQATTIKKHLVTFHQTAMGFMQ